MVWHKDFRNGIKEVGENIATIVNSALLFLAYTIGIGITSIIAKLFGKKFIGLKKENKDSYWEELNLGKEETGRYYRQF